jgi:hypothetical protein
VAFEIPEHVADRVANLGGGVEDVCMVPIGKYRAAPAHHGVQMSRETYGQGAHADSEASGPIRFDDDMDVVSLDAEVHDAEVAASA